MNEIDEQSRCGITKTSRRFRACCRTREVRRRMTILCSGWPLPTGVLSRHPIGDHAGWNPRCRVLLQHLLRVGFAVPRVGHFFLCFSRTLPSLSGSNGIQRRWRTLGTSTFIHSADSSADLGILFLSTISTIGIACVSGNKSCTSSPGVSGLEVGKQFELCTWRGRVSFVTGWHLEEF